MIFVYDEETAQMRTGYIPEIGDTVIVITEIPQGFTKYAVVEILPVSAYLLEARVQETMCKLIPLPEGGKPKLIPSNLCKRVV